jgi:hypothetical protein
MSDRPPVPSDPKESSHFLEFERHYDRARHIRHVFEVTTDFVETERKMASLHVLIVSLIGLFFLRELFAQIDRLYAILALAVFIIAIGAILLSVRRSTARLLYQARAEYQASINAEAAFHMQNLSKV